MSTPVPVGRSVQATRVLAQVLVAGATVLFRAGTQAWQQALHSELDPSRERDMPQQHHLEDPWVHHPHPQHVHAVCDTVSTVGVPTRGEVSPSASRAVETLCAAGDSKQPDRLTL